MCSKIATIYFMIEHQGTVKILSEIDLAVLGPVLFYPSASSVSSSLDMSRYLLLPHSCSTVYLSLAVTSMGVELSSGKVPTTLVPLISRLMRSISLFVLIRRQCSGGNSVQASVSANPSRTVLVAAPRSFGTLNSTSSAPVTRFLA